MSHAPSKQLGLIGGPFDGKLVGFDGDTPPLEVRMPDLDPIHIGFHKSGEEIPATDLASHTYKLGSYGPGYAAYSYAGKEHCDC